MIPIFIGYDKRERVATNVLIDSIYNHSSDPVSVTPLVLEQLQSENLYWRDREPNQSTDFSFSRFLVPYLMKFDGWAIFMDCDMLIQNDISELWKQRDNRYTLMCVKHNYKPTNKTKFLGEKQTVYPKKNWSSLMLLNCSKCKKLTPDYINQASGLALHRFFWIEDEENIGDIDISWNFLVDYNNSSEVRKINNLHWTEGGPWFKDKKIKNTIYDKYWFKAKQDAFQI